MSFLTNSSFPPTFLPSNLSACNDIWFKTETNPINLSGKQTLIDIKNKSSIDFPTNLTTADFIASVLSELFSYKSSELIRAYSEINEIFNNISLIFQEINNQIKICQILINEINSYGNSKSFLHSIMEKSKEEAIFWISKNYLNQAYEILPLKSKEKLNKKYKALYPQFEEDQYKILQHKANEIISYKNQIENIGKCSNSMSISEDEPILIEELENLKRNLKNEFELFSNLYEKDGKYQFLYNSNPSINKHYYLYKASYQNFVKAYENSIHSIIQNKQEYSFYNSPYLYSINRSENKPSLLIFNTETKEQEIVSIETSETLSWCTCIAPLPNNELFCFGSATYSSNSYIISTIDFSSKKIPLSTPCYSASPIYYKNSIYIFGGFNDYIMPLAEKYDLIDKKWKKLIPLPSASDCCSCVLFKENILISGRFHRKIYAYNTDLESYSELPIDLGRVLHKMLVTWNMTVYAFVDNGVALESEIGNEFKWNKIGILLWPCLYKAYRVYGKNSCFFIEANKKENHYYFYLDLKKRTNLLIAKN
ncbi:unnamed protein product [Blepharisma stoltei]|uniref:Uncharacterized protein n=1 Tax=Blepharisma stoltei TaxID=1481888 RepID=A0AAU9KHR8_9CILI|nr:unnamed protein product [Blepharisma stoltei]